ncbi:MAG: histidinol-phosphate transaminase [Oscillospiraceae bacterium]|nr:histidinol-phosphate transaminase [Oscillospiraceae bacterium]
MISKLAKSLAPYVPGEQLNDRRYIKLNTNESPYPPSPAVKAALDAFDYRQLRLYSDPEAAELRAAIAEANGVTPDMVMAGGGSDEILTCAFMAFFDAGDNIFYPDITYGFYPVLSRLFRLNPQTPPLDGALRADIDDYMRADGHIVTANPNAPTGIALAPSEIERVLAADGRRLFIADEAYIDFTEDKSCAPLLKKYDNLLIIRTYSKSHNLAGMRLGYALGAPALIDALRRVKNSFNPYNLDRVSIAAGAAAILDAPYLRETAAKIIKTREDTRLGLEKLGFEVLPSEANFLFARREGISGGQLYRTLRENGVLVRYFDKPRVSDFIRISIGTPADMSRVLEILKECEEYQ